MQTTIEAEREYVCGLWDKLRTKAGVNAVKEAAEAAGQPEDFDWQDCDEEDLYALRIALKLRLPSV